MERKFENAPEDSLKSGRDNHIFVNLFSYLVGKLRFVYLQIRHTLENQSTKLLRYSSLSYYNISQYLQMAKYVHVDFLVILWSLP